MHVFAPPKTHTHIHTHTHTHTHTHIKGEKKEGKKRNNRQNNPLQFDFNHKTVPFMPSVVIAVLTCIAPSNTSTVSTPMFFSSNAVSTSTVLTRNASAKANKPVRVKPDSMSHSFSKYVFTFNASANACTILIYIHTVNAAHSICTQMGEDAHATVKQKKEKTKKVTSIRSNRCQRPR